MNDEPIGKHKFLHDSKMSFQQVYDFAYKEMGPLLQKMAEEMGRDRFLETLSRLASEATLREMRDAALRASCNDFEAYVVEMRNRSYLSKHVLTFDIVEDTSTTFGIKVTECLWAKVFRENEAADIGYALQCSSDYAHCQGFNPRIALLRTKTLMQGDEYCDHRWVWEEEK